MTILETLREAYWEACGSPYGRTGKLDTVITLLEAGFEPSDDYEESLEEYNKEYFKRGDLPASL
jgi:hypothetical protein